MSSHNQIVVRLTESGNRARPLGSRSSPWILITVNFDIYCVLSSYSLNAKMTVSEINSTQLLLLKARANNYANYKPSRELPAEHGVLTEDIDHCLALGLVRIIL